MQKSVISNSSRIYTSSDRGQHAAFQIKFHKKIKLGVMSSYDYLHFKGLSKHAKVSHIAQPFC